MTRHRTPRPALHTCAALYATACVALLWAAAMWSSPLLAIPGIVAGGAAIACVIEVAERRREQAREDDDRVSGT